jgi:hypothetical protein
MPATVTPRFPWSFQGGTNPTWTLKYTVHDAASESEAKTALAAAAPATYDGLVRDAYTADEEGNGLWLAEVRYVASDMQKKPIPVGETRESFDTGGGTQHITQSKQTPTTYSANELPAPDFKGAIGVSSDAVEGCDVTTPAYAFSYTKAFTPEQVASLKPAWYALTGMVNNGTFKNFAAGEVLFEGAEGSTRDDGNYDVTFRFQAKPNRTNQTIGTITGIQYEGWNYVWVLYAPKEDTDAKRVTQRPIAVYVERVYGSGDFSTLGV